MLSILIMSAVLGGYQVYSFFYNRKWEQQQKPNIGSMMFFPYLRIIPMHLTIIFGGAIIQGRGDGVGVRLAMLLFMGLKTGADVLMHIIERRGFADKPKKQVAA